MKVNYDEVIVINKIMLIKIIISRCCKNVLEKYFGLCESNVNFFLHTIVQFSYLAETYSTLVHLRYD